MNYPKIHLFFITYCISLTAEVKLYKSIKPEETSLTLGYVEIIKPIENFLETTKTLKKYADDPNIDCIILHINSPGGYPGNSHIIADFILSIREIKPVIAFISDSGTSGAYWIAAACTLIIAPPTAHIGSIGVVSEYPKKNPNITFTAGRFKRPHYLGKGVLDPEDVEIIQGRLDKTFDIFCQQISELRNIPIETIKSWEAQVFLGATAQELGLVDVLGTLSTVIEKAMELVATRKTAAPCVVRMVTPEDEIFEFAV